MIREKDNTLPVKDQERRLGHLRLLKSEAHRLGVRPREDLAYFCQSGISRASELYTKTTENLANPPA
jgi:hypothetical protein